MTVILNDNTSHAGRLQILGCLENCLTVTIMCLREERFLSSGQLLRYLINFDGTQTTICAACIALCIGCSFQEVLHSQ